MMQPGYISSNTIIEYTLTQFLGELEKRFGGDVLVFVGPIVGGIQTEIRDAVELIRAQRGPRKQKRKKLIVVLETHGGYIETVERIANTLRQHYAAVEFVVPDFAMSAGTVLVMSGDAIHMDYYSTLGPIDPQVQKDGSNDLVPALGYLGKYDELVEKSRNGDLTGAELQFLIEKFDPADLHKYEQAKLLSVSLLENWLAKYKFKNWKRTETRGVRVTKEMKKARAKEIGDHLNDTELWHTHSRGISMNELRRAPMKLVIEDFGNETELARELKEYYELLKDYMEKMSYMGVIHTMEHLKLLFPGKR